MIDANRLVGPIPQDAVETETMAELDAHLRRLGLDGAAVTPSDAVHGDPVRWLESAAAEQFVGACRSSSDGAGGLQLDPVPVAVPVPGAAGGRLTERLLALGPAAVRLCPGRHRWDLGGAAAAMLLDLLSTWSVPVLLDLQECTVSAVGRVAAAHPSLRIVAVRPGYRDIRPAWELLDHPNVWLETGTLVGAGQVEWFASAVGAERLIFGTGAPELDDAGPLFTLRYLDLPMVDRDLIAGGTWRRLRRRWTT